MQDEADQGEEIATTDPTTFHRDVDPGAVGEPTEDPRPDPPGSHPPTPEELEQGDDEAADEE